MKYHTGIDMKAGAGPRAGHEPKGRLSNRPMQVEDDLESIIAAMGASAGTNT